MKDIPESQDLVDNPLIETDGNSPDDPISDDLIQIIGDPDRSRHEREKAAHDLYQRHESWVIAQIRKKIRNPADAEDIHQTVWLRVLRPGKLAKNYTNRDGKFRAYLRKPIRWAILKHIEKLPFTVDETGQKTTPLFVEIDDKVVDDAFDESLLEHTIETVITPLLPLVKMNFRTAYIASEYGAIFSQRPSLQEVAQINAIETHEAAALMDTTKTKLLADCTPEEQSVHLPLNYETLVDPVELKNSTGRYLADLLAITPPTFRIRLHRARAKLLELVRVKLQANNGTYNG